MDTSDVYGLRKNAELVGLAVRGRPNQALTTTKFGSRGDRRIANINSRPEYVRQACEASLKGKPSVRWRGLVEAGKVRALGLSEVAPHTIRHARKVHPIATLQKNSL